MMMTLTSAGRQGLKVDHQDRPWPAKNHVKHSLPPDQSKAASPLHLLQEGENHTGPSCVGLDSGAAEDDPQGEDAGETSETPQVQSGDCGSEGHLSLPKDLSTAHPEVAFPEGGEGDRPGLQDRPAVPVGGDTVSPGSSGGLSGQAI